MIVDDVRRTVADGRSELSARISPEGMEPVRVWFTCPEELAPQGGADATPFLPSALHWCMRRDEELVIDGPVSPQVLDGLDDTMDVMYSLFPGRLRPARVTAHPGAPPPGADITACCFSRGVDSWHTVLTSLAAKADGDPPPTHLLYSPGHLSRYFTDGQVRHKADAVREVGDALGLGFVEVDTNIKQALEGFKGPILVATTLALGCRRVMIPSGVMQAVLRAKMTHPTLDHRFSTESTRIVHYGQAGRMAKMAVIAESELALRWIDVCKDDYPQSEINCGKCEKCLRTMIGLHVLDALDRCAAFERPLDPALLLTLRRIGEPHSWVELLHALGDGEFDRRLAAGIRLCLMHDQAERMKDLVRGLDEDTRAVRTYRRASRAVSRSMRGFDSAARRVEELQERLLIAHADHR